MLKQLNIFKLFKFEIQCNYIFPIQPMNGLYTCMLYRCRAELTFYATYDNKKKFKTDDC